MNRLTRKIIAFVFIAIFVIGAPILIIYTAGYRYNYKKGSLEKSGALVIKTDPSRAEVFLNNKNINEKTPIRLNNVIPDDYNILLKKDGFYDWTKKLTVKSKETTFAEDVVLFKKSEAQKIIEQPVNWISFAPNNDYAVFCVTEFEQDYLYLLNLKNQKTSLVYNNNQIFVNPEIIWALDNSNFLFKTDSQLISFPAFLPSRYQDLSSLTPAENLSNIKWNPKNASEFFTLQNNSIIKINVNQNNYEKFFIPDKQIQIIDFLIKQEKIYIISKINSKVFLGQYELADKKLVKTLELNNENNYFSQNKTSLLFITDKQNSNFYIINPELDKILFQKNNIQNTDLNENQNLLLQTNHELVILNFDNFQEKNITRYSSGLSFATWHKSPNYVFALQDGKISIIELDERDFHYIITLPYQNISQFNLDNKAKNLYFIQDDYLWYLEIQ